MFGKVLNTPVETRPRYLQRHSRKLEQYGRLEEFWIAVILKIIRNPDLLLITDDYTSSGWWIAIFKSFSVMPSPCV